MQNYSSAVAVDIPITLRSLRKVRAVAVRNVTLDGLDQNDSCIGIYVDGNSVYHVNVNLFELRNGTIPIFEGLLDLLIVSSFTLKGFAGAGEIFSFQINLDKEYIDVGTSLEAFSLPTTSPYVFLKLSNGVWTSNQISLSPHIPYISPIVSNIEPRSLSYSWILDSARVVQRLIESRRVVEAEVSDVKAQIFELHELAMKKLRRQIVLARKACEEKTRILDRLEQTVVETESMLFHKRNAYEARIRALETTIESRPAKAISYATLLSLEQSKRNLADKKLWKLKEVFPVERHQNIFTISGYPFSKWNPDIRNEELLSAALGITVLMVLTVSVILGLHFRPKLSFCGSRSSLFDILTETELPLYYKGVDKARYTRGVELLHDAVCELLVVSRRGEGRSSELLADVYRLVQPERVEDIW